ncbi:hypothetical protein [Halogeometricum sp. CBA1124]|uniref:hypothetical protein n=1 Tax=Halogeometricum sp. CBA1124 TaxID=2668071 RepID=UPI001429EFB7|nr:hypothetical protein [Halogeometricum sp. CBA1124]MUV57211.1 hypothetical protein [Halogeometricum sp. CBA1124]
MSDGAVQNGGNQNDADAVDLLEEAADAVSHPRSRELVRDALQLETSIRNGTGVYGLIRQAEADLDAPLEDDDE